MNKLEEKKVIVLRFRKSIFLFTTVLLLQYCGEDKTIEKKSKNVIPKEDILSNIVIDEELGISYRTPLHWELMSSELSERYVARLDSEQFDGNFIVYQPKAFYFNSGISGLLRIGSINKNITSEETELSIDSYISRFRKFNPIKDFERKTIQTNNLVITQLIIKKSSLLSFKNIFMNNQNRIIQFDFSIQEKDYEDEKEKINSSLAAIELL